jgi:seryl-tRNA synthetase
MLDMNLIRETPEIVIKSMQDRQMDSALIDRVIELDSNRRVTLAEVEKLKAERNTASKAIGLSKDPAERNSKIEAMRVVSDQITALDQQVKTIEEELNSLMLIIPNTVDPKVPYGESEAGNVIVRYEGKAADPAFEMIPHWDVAGHD